MIRYILTISSILLIGYACKTESKHITGLNTEAVIENEKMLLGEIDRNGLMLPEYQNWFDSTYNSYTVDRAVSPTLTELLKDVELKIFLGTWCSDSQSEIPALFKILDEAKFDPSKLHMIAVDREKKLPKELVEGNNIEYVPTIIIFKNQKELGRIIETPNLSLEKDLLALINH